MTGFDIALGLKPQFSFKVSQQLVCVLLVFFFCLFFAVTEDFKMKLI